MATQLVIKGVRPENTEYKSMAEQFVPPYLITYSKASAQQAMISISIYECMRMKPGRKKSRACILSVRIQTTCFVFLVTFVWTSVAIDWAHIYRVLSFPPIRKHRVFHVVLHGLMNIQAAFDAFDRNKTKTTTKMELCVEPRLGVGLGVEIRRTHWADQTKIHTQNWQ